MLCKCRHATKKTAHNTYTTYAAVKFDGMDGLAERGNRKSEKKPHTDMNTVKTKTSTLLVFEWNSLSLSRSLFILAPKVILSCHWKTIRYFQLWMNIHTTYTHIHIIFFSLDLVLFRSTVHANPPAYKVIWKHNVSSF